MARTEEERYAPAAVPQEPFHPQTEEKPHRGDTRPDHEERLEDVRADVGDVGDGLSWGFGDIERSSLREPSDEKGEDGGEPDEGCEEGYPDVPPMVSMRRAGEGIRVDLAASVTHEYDTSGFVPFDSRPVDLLL